MNETQPVEVKAVGSSELLGAPLRLSKRVPARMRTLTALWCRRDFMAMSQEFRRIRAKSKRPMDTCYWCGHAFLDGEMMGLACFKEKGNRTLCQSCADELLASAPNGRTEATRSECVASSEWFDTTNGGKMISPGEITKGMTVTIHHWLPREIPDIFGMGGGIGTTQTHTDHSWCGDALKVLAVKLPYVRVQLPGSWGAHTLDTREMVLMELPDDFVSNADLSHAAPPAASTSATGTTGRRCAPRKGSAL